MFPLKQRKIREIFEILTPKNMVQRLPVALAQVKAGNTPKNFLNKIRQIICSLYRAKGITKKGYKNILQKYIRYNTKMNSTFMNFKNCKTSDPYRLLVNLTDKINLTRSDKYLALSNVSIYYT